MKWNKIIILYFPESQGAAAEGSVADPCSRPGSWKLAEGLFLPKVEAFSTIAQFSIIPLLTVEYRIFFSVLARYLTSYMMQNCYINTSTKKENSQAFLGCVGHATMIILRSKLKDKQTNSCLVRPHKYLQAIPTWRHPRRTWHLPYSEGSLRNDDQLPWGGSDSDQANSQATGRNSKKGFKIHHLPHSIHNGMNFLMAAAEGMSPSPRLECNSPSTL